MIPGEQKSPGVSPKEPPRGRAIAAEHLDAKLQPAPFLFSILPTFSSWQMIWRGVDHAEPNPSYLAEDHTDGPDWASWTHGQLGVMMHRMLPINRMCCSAEASQADTPDRATEGGPAKRDQRGQGNRNGSSQIKRRDLNLHEWVKSWSGKWGKKEKWSRFVGQQRRRKKNGRKITLGLYRKSLEGGGGER